MKKLTKNKFRLKYGVREGVLGEDKYEFLVKEWETTEYLAADTPEEFLQALENDGFFDRRGEDVFARYIIESKYPCGSRLVNREVEFDEIKAVLIKTAEPSDKYFEVSYVSDDESDHSGHGWDIFVAPNAYAALDYADELLVEDGYLYLHGIVTCREKRPGDLTPFVRGGIDEEFIRKSAIHVPVEKI